MSPFEHGEVFILDDGGEVDLDLGNYERFAGLTLTRDNNITTGKIYQSVINKERRGDYLGKTVQVIPHICNEIQDWIQRISKVSTDEKEGEPDICVIELGGTVGDIESMPFIEALRQFQFKVGRENFCLVHVSLVPELGSEQKTKPTQQSVRELRALGLFPDVVIGRSKNPLSESTREKIGLFCQVSTEAVFSCNDVSNLFWVPLMLVEQNYPSRLFKTLNLSPISQVPQLDRWKDLALSVDYLQGREDGIHIAMVGKYTGLTDAYLSVIKGLQHSAYYVGKKLIIDWVNSSHLEPAKKEKNPAKYEEAWKLIKSAHGILVPGGFGNRGTEGKIIAANYARTNKIPYFGICLGLQIAVIEYARNVLGWTDATSEEFEVESEHQVVVFMPEISKSVMGGTMRLGARQTIINDKSKIASVLYKRLWNVEGKVNERHRHR
eukprot:TRINITY_DN2908_c0_g1_i1.p1 TRINITY_DN2908_c0_g1~~TRINITY_DN2908_c0_g1_i1.p1  ORF type:complete len:496 (+),score=94.86 TRINITY_DN2908_c0_g1_i1:178-1488(+)